MLGLKSILNYPYVIEVVIPLPIDNTFDYLVSEAEYELIKVGYRVVVSFGSKKLYTGIVLNKSKNKNIEYALKEIKFIVDDVACISKSQINFFKWISQYYMSPLGNVFESALPKSFLIKSESVLIAKNKFIDDNVSEKSIKILEKINEKNEIILARDQFGIKPLYYSYDKGDLIFSSEIKPILMYEKKITLDKKNTFEFFLEGSMDHFDKTFFIIRQFL